MEEMNDLKVPVFYWFCMRIEDSSRFILSQLMLRALSICRN